MRLGDLLLSGSTRGHLLFLYAVLVPAGLDAQVGRTTRDGWQRVDAIFEALEVEEGDVIADVGAGSGFFTFRLSPRVGPTGRVLAVDIDDDVLEDLADEAGRAGLQNIETIVSDDDDPGLQPQSVDGVLIVNAYHEMREYESMLAGIRLALRADGRLVIVDNPPDNPGHSRRRQTRRHDIAIDIVADELEAAGFRVIRRDPDFIDDRRADQRDWLLVAVVSP
jgi:ubiquinone/menaquinone biosynthesis C-methylase UbiE